MKKNGFTLAEVLITMMIVGVVAALTLPALNADVNEQAAVTKFKKALAIASNVGGITNASDDFNYSTITLNTKPKSESIYDTNNQLKKGIWQMYKAHAKVNEGGSVKLANDTKAYGECTSQMIRILLKDGVMMCFNSTATESGEGTAKGSAYRQGFIDINGIRKPNKLSVCDDEGCTKNKEIYDQFAITVHEEDAYPGHQTFDANGPVITDKASTDYNAAQWAANQ